MIKILILREKNYVIANLDLKTLLYQKNKDFIAENFLELGSEILNQIEEVSIYLWKHYQSVVEQLLPNAKVVADRFHVMKEVNE